jgi:hypothetical protein
MKKIINVNGQKVRRAVLASGFSKEQVVASVQDAGLKFSLAGLDKIYRGELPVKDSDAILEAIAFKCHCQATEFADPEAQTA